MLDFIKLEVKNKHQIQQLLRLTTRDAAPERYQLRPVSLQTLQPSYALSKVKNEIGFPTLTSDVFLNQKLNKQTSHE